MQEISNVMQYKPEPKVVKLEWWDVECGDIGTKRMTTSQLEALLDAEQRGVRLVRFEDYVVNTSFVRGANRVVKSKTESDLKHFPISKDEEKYIIEDRRPKMLKKG